MPHTQPIMWPAARAAADVIVALKTEEKRSTAGELALPLSARYAIG